MYELEVRHASRQDLVQLDVTHHDHAGQRPDVQAIAIIPWEEHCTECAIPACYETCPLYEARADGRCRRFVDGFVPVRARIPGIPSEMVSVRFKRWAELMAYGNAKLVRIDRARRLERALRPFEALGSLALDRRISVRGRRGVTTRLIRRLKQHVARNSPFPAIDNDPPDLFIAEILNPNSFVVNLSLTIRNSDPESTLPFQALLELAPGFKRYQAECSEISKYVDLSRDFVITLSPNITEPQDEGLELLFGTLSFVRISVRPEARASMQPRTRRSPKHVKIVAWDLDNTVWQGTLLESGPGTVTLMPGVSDVIHELARRGIVSTLVSKNNERDALRELERFGLEAYFVFPKVSWSPKSVSLHELIQQFNIGDDAVAFVDDSPFERAEVQARLPRVRTYAATDYSRLLTLPEFQPPVSSDSARRREFYRSQEARDRARSDFAGSYDDFLRKANIRLNVARAGAGQLERICELAQRTNQLNFSNARYSNETVARMLEDEALDCFVMRCEDSFGDYGTVGFAVVDKAGPTLVDLMFSCRIQSKRIEHAFLEFLLSWEAKHGHDRLDARYVKTDRNSAAGRVFDDLGFALVASREETRTLRLAWGDRDLGHQPPIVYWEAQPWSW
jgi:FkbH-like protein